MTKRKAVFTGSFDPLTLGHLNLIERASKQFDQLIILVAVNKQKKALFNASERVELIRPNVQHLPNVSVEVLLDDLVVHYCKLHQAYTIIRGVRNSQDFEYEYNIAEANRMLCPEVETMLLYADAAYRCLSSSIIKEIAFFKGQIDTMVPPNVARAIQSKIETY